jgi:tRNA(Ile)-lysidine synthase
MRFQPHVPAGRVIASASAPNARKRLPVIIMDASTAQYLTERFTVAMERLGPFEPRPRLAVAVSGGADSMALALLAQGWATRRDGGVLALTVDHGLRAASSAEADLTLSRLASLGIEGRKLTIAGLTRGSALAERAREARYRALLEACAAAGIPHLLLGHHREDQVETVMMRALSGSATRGLTGMPALTETRHVRLLRPLLQAAPERLRDDLAAHGIAWIEDPSNRDPLAQRARLRAARAGTAGTAEGTIAVAEAARLAGSFRERRDRATAQTLAARVTIRPEGYALLTPGPIEPEALAALLRTIAGAAFAPPIDRVAQIARAPGPATLGGVRIMAAGRFGPGWLLVREPRAVDEPVPACPNARWDGRFRLTGWPPDGLGRDLLGHDRLVHDRLGEGLTLGALGACSAEFRDRNGPPAAVMHGLPALRLDGRPIAVPHIGVGDARWHVLFDPRNPAAGAPFLPA